MPTRRRCARQSGGINAVHRVRTRRLAGANAAAVVVSTTGRCSMASATPTSRRPRRRPGARGLTGKWMLTLQNTTRQPALANLKNRDLRKRLHDASSARGNAADPNTTESTIARLAQLRAQQARGCSVSDLCRLRARRPDGEDTRQGAEADDRHRAPATARAREEAARMQKLIDQEGGGFTLAPWDWQFYAERVRKADYDIDESEVRPSFRAESRAPGWRVLRGETGCTASRSPSGTTYRCITPTCASGKSMTPTARRSGSSTETSSRDRTRTAVGGPAATSDSRSCSGPGTSSPITRTSPNPLPGEAALLTSDDVTTMFHEFGHALHSLFSTVRYPRSKRHRARLHGFPSQLNEHWAFDPVVFAKYAKHHQTRARRCPQALLEKIKEDADVRPGICDQRERRGRPARPRVAHAPGRCAAPERSARSVSGAEAVQRRRAPQVPPRYLWP